MENNIILCKYLKIKDLTDISIFVNLYQDFQYDRGAECEESVFDLYDYKDFYLFCNLYNDVEYGLECQIKSRYWIAGMAKMFENKNAMKFPNNYIDCCEFIEKIMDVNTILNRPDIYGEYFNIDAIKNDSIKEYAPNNDAKNSLLLSVCVQKFTIYFWEYIYFLNNNVYDIPECDVLDVAYNIGEDFWRKYQKTLFQDFSFDECAYAFISKAINEDAYDIERLYGMDCLSAKKQMFDYFHGKIK